MKRKGIDYRTMQVYVIDEANWRTIGWKAADSDGKTHFENAQFHDDSTLVLAVQNLILAAVNADRKVRLLP